MATNGKAGDGQKKATIREGLQILNPKPAQWVKRNANFDRFREVKIDGIPFKEVRKARGN
ncbi:hypothetical protein [Pedobacter sp. JY14-1]|uniref:hypothetical protein n=1 Tax=Pedobacter sp. JY14-1 TaxID=3034151 RepID=UPI0023E30D0F|nr:hypothetical protein [Pedobacter sp. JY14-1]